GRRRTPPTARRAAAPRARGGGRFSSARVLGAGHVRLTSRGFPVVPRYPVPERRARRLRCTDGPGPATHLPDRRLGARLPQLLRQGTGAGLRLRGLAALAHREG